MARQIGILLLALAAIAAAQDNQCTDTRITFDDLNMTDSAYPEFERGLLRDARCSFHPEPDEEGERHYLFDYEWEGYDGWYNNPSHPDWGGAGELLWLIHAVLRICRRGACLRTCTCILESLGLLL